MNQPIRKKRVWTVADFAAHAEMKHRPARRMLKRLDAKHGGKLLIPSEGENREYKFFPAVLARLEPDLFTPVESLELRLEDAEESIGQLRADQRRVVSQVGQNTRAIEKMRQRPSAA